MKKGFTLIEILIVIIILGVVGLIVFPGVNSIIKNNKEKLYNKQLEEIKLASEKWAYNNIDLLPSNEGKSVTLTLLSLKRGGYLPLDIRDPRDGELLSNGLSVVITYEANHYKYTINNIISNTQYNENSPIIVLNGEPIETIEINETYTEKNVVAKDSDDNVLNNVIITYYNNGKEIAKIDTTQLKTYTVEYSVTDNNLTTVVTRTVIINDTIAPEITLPEKVTITSLEASSYDLMAGVTITDNSNKKPTIEISGFDASIGEKIVNYKACDTSDNCTTKNRIIKVN